MLFRWIKYLCKYLGLEIQYFYILNYVGITYCYLPFGCRSWKIKLIKKHYTTIKNRPLCFLKLDLHDTTCCIRLSGWRMSFTLHACELPFLTLF